MLILGLLGMYFDATVVFVTKSSLLFRLALAILWVEGVIDPWVEIPAVFPPFVGALENHLANTS